jgi:HEAT repeat protein
MARFFPHVASVLPWLVAVLTLGTALGLGGGPATGTAFAQPARSAPSKAHLRELLSGYETVPPASTWAALGPSALRGLAELYQDHSQPPYVRLRAVWAASHYETALCREFLLAVANAPGQNDLFVRQAVLALGRAFGARATEALVPFLSRPEPVVRVAAGRALARIGNPAARRALSERLRVESSPSVRASLEAALQTPRPSLGAERGSGIGS